MPGKDSGPAGLCAGLKPDTGLGAPVQMSWYWTVAWSGVSSVCNVSVAARALGALGVQLMVKLTGGASGSILKGAEGAPAVVLLHRYGGDRSWLFNLGVKINETTNFTILWPDLRGHGENPLIKSTSLGVREGDDLLGAIKYLRGLKTEGQKTLVGESLGVYGVELGAYSALKAARNEPQIKVLVLDSVVTSPTDLLNTAVSSCVGLDNGLVQYFSRVAMKAYMLGGFEDTSACEFAGGIRDQKVMLLSGADAGALRDATASLQKCFPNAGNVEVRTDLPLSGFGLPSVTGEQGEAYDRVVIEFFARNLH